MIKQSLQNSAGNVLGKLLFQQRRETGYSQGELAALAGVSIPTLRLLEQGKGRMSSFWLVLSALGLELNGRNLPTGETIGARISALRKCRTISQRELANIAGVSHPTIVAIETGGRGRLETLDTILLLLGAGAYLQRIGTKPAFYTHTGNSSLDHGWTTPTTLLEKLYEVFGTFDLDPCSPTADRRLAPVKARMYYTEKDDGLSLCWSGKVFLNPPYGRRLGLWVAKAKREALERRASCVTALIPARTDTRWWHDHVAESAHTFLLRGRLSFGSGEVAAPFPSALAVWGGDKDILNRLRQTFPDAWYVAPPVSFEEG